MAVLLLSIQFLPAGLVSPKPQNPNFLNYNIILFIRSNQVLSLSKSKEIVAFLVTWVVFWKLSLCWFNSIKLFLWSFSISLMLPPFILGCLRQHYPCIFIAVIPQELNSLQLFSWPLSQHPSRVVQVWLLVLLVTCQQMRLGLVVLGVSDRLVHLQIWQSACTHHWVSSEAVIVSDVSLVVPSLSIEVNLTLHGRRLLVYLIRVLFYRFNFFKLLRILVFILTSLSAASRLLVVHFVRRGIHLNQVLILTAWLRLHVNAHFWAWEHIELWVSINNGALVKFLNAKLDLCLLFLHDSFLPVMQPRWLVVSGLNSLLCLSLLVPFHELCNDFWSKALVQVEHRLRKALHLLVLVGPLIFHLWLDVLRDFKADVIAFEHLLNQDLVDVLEVHFALPALVCFHFVLLEDSQDVFVLHKDAQFFVDVIWGGVEDHVFSTWKRLRSEFAVISELLVSKGNWKFN